MECHLLWHFIISYIASLLLHHHFHVHYCHMYMLRMVQLKFNFTHARKDTRAFASFLRGITEYFSSI